ncbi:fimbrial protein [Serratia sp. UGAL515B_01]|uniref:fimbrial protein n=1 Tax=Serratia sp. UGAL515B_01 TaxID=2986763 RepID=UPI0029534FEF|nr:fimbrial protein [Serratia sp. UGAL515B_01]WON76641.1 fimbrial protein [Serratia sp. UGAL515B_01]
MQLIRITHQYLMMTLFILVAMTFTHLASAECYKITTASQDPNSPYYIEPGKGNAVHWDGATSASGSSGSLPSVININTVAFQANTSLIASGTVSFLQSGGQPYSAEQVLFRCTPDEAGKLYEYYATNGGSAHAGNVELGSAYGLPETYQTAATGMGLRATNLVTGEYYSRYWKARPLINLETDSQGWILVKAKHFSDTYVELFRLETAQGSNTTGIYALPQPNTYIAFRGGTLSSDLKVGTDSFNTSSNGSAYSPGAVSLYNRVYIRRAASCSVTNVTPTVTFPVITVSELRSGGSRQMPVTINFDCQTGSPANGHLTDFSNGIAANHTAMGILVNPANAAAAISAGFGLSGGAVSYLLSDGYGSDPGVATGVGIQFSRPNGTPLNLLTTLTGVESAGWYPVLDDATAGAVVNGVTRYTKTLNATLKALPGNKVTAGKIDATAQVIIQVQ